MKRLLFVFTLLSIAVPAKADITHSLSSSVQLQVNAAATQVERIGSSFSITGSGVDTTDGNTASTISAGTITSGVYAPGTIAATQDVPGASFSFTQQYTQADAVATSAPTVGTVGNFSDQTSTSAGTADSSNSVFHGQKLLPTWTPFQNEIHAPFPPDSKPPGHHRDSNPVGQ